MPRPKQMNDNEVATWLAVLLDTAFDPAINAVDHKGRAQLLALASDFTHYPDDFPNPRRAELLLRWVDFWLPADWWPRLQNRVRKRRSRAGAEKSDAANNA